ncbi:MAG: L,D-transpeptidase family protein [Sphingomicrobium sp.]
MTYRLLISAAVVLGLAAPGAAAAWQSQPIEPIAIPPSVEQGVDMVYIDRELNADIRLRNQAMEQNAFGNYGGVPFDLLETVNPMFTDLRRGLVRYQMEWASLPQFAISPGPALKLGAEGERVAMLRERLGLGFGTRFDQPLAARVTRYQQIHGLKPDGIVGNAMIASLNLGAEHYERVLMINMERARRLPAPGEARRYIVVDAGSARLFLYDNDRMVDSMRAVVGTAETETPMMAALMRFSSVNPYWNVPPELNSKIVAPNVLKQGLGYLTERKYEAFAGWSDKAPQLDPAKIDWQGVKDGTVEVRLRRRPGPGNSMGDIKFMMPNDFGIYLHDTHDKSVFKVDNRWISTGCVRVEDAHRLATWLFGAMPVGRDPDVEERVDLPEPVPVFMTYLTAAATHDGVVFRADPYNRDPAVLARYFGEDRQMAEVGQH